MKCHAKRKMMKRCCYNNFNSFYCLCFECQQVSAEQGRQDFSSNLFYFLSLSLAQQRRAHALLSQHVSLSIQTEVKNITLTSGWKNFFFVFYIAYCALLQSSSNSQQAARTRENTNLIVEVIPSTVCLQFLLCLFQPKVNSYVSTTVFVFTQCTQSPCTFMVIKINFLNAQSFIIEQLILPNNVSEIVDSSSSHNFNLPPFDSFITVQP